MKIEERFVLKLEGSLLKKKTRVTPESLNSEIIISDYPIKVHIILNNKRRKDINLKVRYTFVDKWDDYASVRGTNRKKNNKSSILIKLSAYVFYGKIIVLSASPY